MNAEYGEHEELGPSGVPFVNDPEKPANKRDEQREPVIDDDAEEPEH
jgi:hypothetical protein